MKNATSVRLTMSEGVSYGHTVTTKRNTPFLRFDFGNELRKLGFSLADINDLHFFVVGSNLIQSSLSSLSYQFLHPPTVRTREGDRFKLSEIDPMQRWVFG